MHLDGEFDHGTDDEHRGGSGPGSQDVTGADRAGDLDQDADLEPDVTGVEIPIGIPMTAEEFRAAKQAAERPDPPGQR